MPADRAAAGRLFLLVAPGICWGLFCFASSEVCLDIHIVIHKWMLEQLAKTRWSLIVDVSSEGKMLLSESQKSFLRLLPEVFRGRRIELVVDRFSESRSLNQLRYFRGPVVAHVKACIEDSYGGYVSEDDVAEFLKVRCAPQRIVNYQTGEETIIGRSTSSMTVEEFGNFLDEVALFCMEEFGVAPPEPKHKVK